MSVQPNIHVPIIGLSEPSEQKISISSDNPKKVCLVYKLQHDAKAFHEFLEKVFKAIQLDYEKQTSKITLKDDIGFSLAQSSYFQQHEIWICLGVSPQSLGLNFEMTMYQPISFQNNHVLWTDDPEVILENPTLKKQLWVSLQKLFPTK